MIEATPYISQNMLMIAFSLLLFFFIVPYIRKREDILGVRYVLVGFLIVGLGMTIVPIINGKYEVLFIQSIYYAHYIFLTFLYCPEVLGMDVDIRKWFRKYKQLIIVIIYIALVVFYSMGFAWIYYQMSIDPAHKAFTIGFDKPTSYGTFLYYSIITFTTVGYGEITPLSTGARILASSEAILGMTINVLFIAILFMYISNVPTMMREQKKIEKQESKIEKKLKIKN